MLGVTPGGVVWNLIYCHSSAVSPGQFNEGPVYSGRDWNNCCFIYCSKNTESVMLHHAKYVWNNLKQKRIRELLNEGPQCHDDAKLLAQNVICSFLSHV